MFDPTVNETDVEISDNSRLRFFKIGLDNRTYVKWTFKKVNIEV